MANIGPIRQALVEEHLGEHDYVLWIDADVVDYPPDLPSRLIERDPLGISAPLVLAAGGGGRFYDTAGFVEEGAGPTFTCRTFASRGRCTTWTAWAASTWCRRRSTATAPGTGRRRGTPSTCRSAGTRGRRAGR